MAVAARNLLFNFWFFAAHYSELHEVRTAAYSKRNSRYDAHDVAIPYEVFLKQTALHKIRHIFHAPHLADFARQNAPKQGNLPARVLIGRERDQRRPRAVF